MEKVDRTRAEVCERLKARRPEIEQSIVSQIAEAPGWLEGDGGRVPQLAEAVSSGVAYGLSGVESGAEGPVPQPLLRLARQAAQDGIRLESLFRCHLAGYALFGDFILQAAEEESTLHGRALRQIVYSQTTLLGRVLAAVAREHAREWRGWYRVSEARRLECVKGLLAGELADTAILAYEIEDWHVGAVARGAGAVHALREIASAADRRLLLVRPEEEEEEMWAWFGGRRRAEVAELTRRAGPTVGREALVGLGEPARGIEGWRLTHLQASAALRVARPGSEGFIRYAEVGLLASIAQDRLVSSSLRQLYLVPLTDARDGGTALRSTLRAYFAAGRNVTSAASALGVSRQTVGSRLRTVEQMIGRTIESCAPEIEIALRLEKIDPPMDSPDSVAMGEMST